MADDERDLAEPEETSGGLSPDEIAYRSFSGARRGISETEVREFLREVAEEMVASEARAREAVDRLEARATELEAQLRQQATARPTEEQMLNALGEETARVLLSAQEAADEIKANAAARTEGLVTQAEAEAERVRAAADRVMADRSREADVAAAVKLQEVEGQTRAQVRHAARDAEAEIEGARQRGREMVGEARAVRERILADLGKRRATLQAEVVQLEAAREQLLSAGRVVKRTLADAAQALSPFEGDAVPDADATAPADEADARVETAEALSSAPEPVAGESDDVPAVEPAPPHTGLRSYLRTATHADEAPEPAPEPETPESEEQTEVPSTDEAEDVRGGRERREQPAPVDPVKDGPAPERARPEGKVQDLFARIRADREQAVGAARAVLEVAPEPEPGREANVADSLPEVPAQPEATPSSPPDAAAGRDHDLLARRDETLAPIAQELLRKCKRSLQDEQNELLDRVRRQRGRADGENLLAPFSVQVTDWADVLEPGVDEAYGAGRGSQLEGGHDGVRAPRRLVSGLAEVLVRPLRERLVTSMDAAPGDPGPEREQELSSRIGARYREWRAQELDLRVGDVLAAAYVRGVYDAAPEGSELRWIPAEVGRCPDADDNALEPTARGARFPTGQAFPPAHPGCRCLIATFDGD